MSDYKFYEVYVPVQGRMKIHLRSDCRFNAIVGATNIAAEMCKDSKNTSIPNLSDWFVSVDYVMCNPEKIVVIEKGDSDE